MRLKTFKEYPIIQTIFLTLLFCFGIWIITHLVLSNLGSENRIIAIVDAISAALSAIISAVMAYFISESQANKATLSLRKEQQENEELEKRKNKDNCGLLLMELEDNLEAIRVKKPRLKRDDTPTTFNAIKQGISTMIWDSMISNNGLPNIELQKIYKAYKSLVMLRAFEVPEALTDEDIESINKVIERLEQRFAEAIPILK
ncbi:hypothetical protein [Loigolactobacillus binensis]|uniref:DUF4760 domain-containing protein n=1 Tax=Loigolactobacillus binensis TaxID=2559922 RepID=A0ABW3EE16_9LACO|nr:hypothetical protein [Loigolactobacillus binensis]